MKKNFALLLLASVLLGGCGVNLEFENNDPINQTQTKGTIGDFDLLAPTDNGIVFDNPTFSWEAATNAISYTLEVCSLESFDHQSSTVIYASESNISTTSFKLSTTLNKKDIVYYWRVTAVNQLNSNSVGKTKTSDTYKFTYKSQNSDEIPLDIGDASDWTLHKDGSFATIGIDSSDFFGSGVSDSLTITFEKEDTKQDIQSSDGWIVVTKPMEMDLYGTDSLYFNFYYSGDDASALIRIIDQDGEYYFTEIQISRNAKQAVLMRFDEFTLRTKDTLVQNKEFDYNHIQYLEIVFEKSFGDGCCYVGNFRAVNYSDYADLFVSKLNFNSISTDKWINESYNFGKTISEDGKELELNYTTTAGFNGNEKGIGGYGYGFAKIPLNCYFVKGNALKVKIKYSGYSSNVKSIIRVYEEDEDRWSYETNFTQLSTTEYTEFVIPFVAFAKSEMRGDGARQFFYILQLQLGVSNVYGSGSIFYKDIEIVSIKPASENHRKVGEDGIIEDFDSYTSRTQIYETWETSTANKDEGIFFDSSIKYSDGKNINCGQFNYKSDMEMATYDTYVDVSCVGKNAISFWLKDGSNVKLEDPQLSHLTSDDIRAQFVINLVVKGNRWYRYTIERAPKRWTEYVINFDDFELFSGLELSTSEPFVSENVLNFAFGISYLYYNKNGVHYPVYTESNPVYLDSIRFVSGETKETTLEVELHQDSKTKITQIDDFEYESNEELNLHWFGLNKLEYEKVTLSDVVSSKGGNHSMKLDYKGSKSPSYASYPAFGSDVTAKAISLDIKGDDKAMLYINLYIKSGNTINQYRYTISNVSSSWNRYLIGFDPINFAPVGNAQAPAIAIDTIRSLQRITFGIVGSSNELSSIYIDNVSLDASVRSFTVNTVTAL